MVPTPNNEWMSQDSATSADGEKVVISGMSGMFPQANNTKELADILYNKLDWPAFEKLRNIFSSKLPLFLNTKVFDQCVLLEMTYGIQIAYYASHEKVDPITESDRWKCNNPENRSKIGQVPNLTKFDSQFFKTNLSAEKMEPATRILLEQSFQAVFDAGINPMELKQKNVSVYVAHHFSELETYSLYEYNTIFSSKSLLQGWSKAMIANRISYILDLKGPSTFLSGACTSSLQALQRAYQDIKSGVVEAAIIGGSNNIIGPNLGVHYSRIIPCNRDGKTKSFDENADGVTRSDTICTFFLQRAKNAKRIYAEVVDVTANYNGVLNNTFGFKRDPIVLAKFLKDFYKNCSVPPEAVEYVEAFGSADPEADKIELDVIDNIYCKNRKGPLLVGSVMSNIGYTEAASGAAAIAKVLLGYHTGKLAGNLHCDNPRKDVEALREGRIRILTDNHDFASTAYAAVNNLSITGTNGHLVLKGHYKPKDPKRYETSFPKLLTLTGRMEDSAKKIIDDLKSRPLDHEEIALLHGINSKKISGHLGRSYVILDTNQDGETVCLAEESKHFDKGDRPLWFVYSGMGSQWAGMGAALMRIPVFAAAIQRCHAALEPKGLDIVHIITSPDKSIYDNILNSFVGIAAIQIGLTDLLTCVGIVPDMIIGHSVGELGCAYADGCFTAEEMILSAYSRGLVSVQTPFIKGSMAAVGIGYKEVKKLLPSDIFVACRNALESSTISGPADKMKDFIDILTAKGIFAKEVQCSNIAYHSKYIAEAGPGLLKYLREVIKNPKPRSPRWVSTSVPEAHWKDPVAALSSAEYHTNNLLNPVLFEETSRHIPANAVLVEVAPHGLLQAILRRALPESCVNIPLTRKGHKDNAFLVLEAIGKLYVEGYVPNLENLYPKIEFPVSTSTPMLSHLVEWNHTHDWCASISISTDQIKSTACQLIISNFDDEYKYLSGNIVGERILYPFSAALVAVWDTLSTWMNKTKKEIPVEFTDVHLYSQLLIPEHKALKIRVALYPGSGNFEVTNGKYMVVSGNVVPLLGEHARVAFAHNARSGESLDISSDDIYKVFSEREIYYKDDFRSLIKTNVSLTEAKVLWNNNWVTFIDGLIQLNTLKHSYDYISQPYYIGNLIIDPTEHNSSLIQKNDIRYGIISIIGNGEVTRSNGIAIKSLKYKNLPFIEKYQVVLKSLTNIGISKSVNKGLIAEVSSLQSTKFGDLNSLQWVMTPELAEPGIIVNVEYAAINDIDVKVASGVIQAKESAGYGMDFSGHTKSGARVMGLVRCGSARGRVRARPECLWPVPAHWTLEDAATVPAAYALAFYCLGLKAEMFRGIRILVHGGTGALGQAVISVALANGAQVFTTVSDERKKKFLLKLYPELKEDHIGNSRNSAFADMVQNLTKGDGVDIIISCVKGELKQMSLTCGAMSSIFMDLAQIPNKERFSLGMFHLTKSRNYLAIDFNSIFNDENIEQLKTLQVLMSDGIRLGYVRPLTRVTYAPHEAPRAFRLLAASKHRGRALLRLRPAHTTQPRLVCAANNSQLVLCHESSLGTQWADRLISRGATNLILHSPLVTGFLPFKLQSWKRLGINVRISTSDLNKKHNIENLITECDRLAELEGIYIIACDVKQSNKNVDSVVANLDSVSRQLAPSLKYFSIINYGNKVGSASCAKRMRSSLPANVLDISALKKVSWRNSVDAIERALLSTQPTVSAHLEQLPTKSFTQQIAYVAGIEIGKDAPDSTTLRELGMKHENLWSVLAYITEVHNLTLNEYAILDLTVKELRDMEESLEGIVFKAAKGVGQFFTNVNTDEIEVITPIILKTTLIPSISDEFDVEQTYLFIVPGLEMHHCRFDTLCERLEIPATVLSVLNTEGNNKETVSQTANRLSDYMLETLMMKKKKNFYLLGYESSALVAMELAATLEDKGLTGTVFYLGGAPEEIQANLNAMAEAYSSQEDLETALLVHISSLLADNVEDAVKKNLKHLTSWDDKLESVMVTLRSRTKTSKQYTRILLETTRHNLLQMRYVTIARRKLRSKVVVLRASDIIPADDRSLQDHSKQPVAVHGIPAPLAHVAQDLHCSSVINSHLHPDLRESFMLSDRRELYHMAMFL